MEGDMGLLTTAGTYKEIRPSEKLVFTWGPETPEQADSVVTIEFTDQDDGTLVTLTHEKLPEGMGESHREGWTSALEHLSKEIGNL
jgi:uncharacterized protein YndB with AHSA1/START domain